MLWGQGEQALDLNHIEGHENLEAGLKQILSQRKPKKIVLVSLDSRLQSSHLVRHDRVIYSNSG